MKCENSSTLSMILIDWKNITIIMKAIVSSSIYIFTSLAYSRIWNILDIDSTGSYFSLLRQKRLYNQSLS